MFSKYSIRTNHFKTMKYATFRYDSVEVENGFYPIEEEFPEVKHHLRQNDLVLQSVREPSLLILLVIFDHHSTMLSAVP